MKVLVYPHSMEIGGSQFNAVQLAGAMRDRGHDVLVVSEPGPLVDRLAALRLPHVAIPLHRRRPSPTVVGTLVRLVRERGIDLVHGHEWPPVLDAFLGPALIARVPVVGTVMSMSVAPYLPRCVPLTVGTELIRRSAVAAGFRRVTLLEPPVDTDADTPTVDGAAFRRANGIGAEEILVVAVCRLVPELKLEGLLMACDAMRNLACAGRPVRLVITGDGRARDTVAARAAQTNAAAGREAVLLAGELADPRPAYAAADVVIGQGGSALRGMAFAKPLVVLGEDGFSELLMPETAPTFLRQGWFGLGPGTRGAGAAALAAALDALIASRETRAALGRFARGLVEERFSLRRAAAIQEEVYRAAMAEPVTPGALVADFMRATAGLAASKLTREIQRRRGAVAIDDSNARPLIAAMLTNAPERERGA